MKKKIVLTGIFLLIFVVVLIGTYKLMNSRTFQIFGGITSQVQTDKKEVALTFDDGPTDNVNKILPLLDQYDAKATFFLIGNELKQHPEEGKKIALAGYQIGNHTFSHKRMVFKSYSYIKHEVEETNILIRQTGYTGEIDFRPPNGKKLIGLPVYLMKHNIKTITWSLEPDTYYTSVSDKVGYVKKNVRPGSIILLHPMYDKTGNELKTIKGVLDALSKQGYKFVTVNELKKG